MKVVDNKALLLKVRNPAKITTVIPKSRDIGNNKVLVNFGLDEAKVLNNLNIKAPSPIEHQYNWPGKFKPFSHQKTTSSFLTLNQKCFCFNEQGTGKTASAIWASDFLMKQGRVNKVVVVCPLSIMNSAWREDLFTFAMHRSVEVCHGSAKKRKQIVSQKADYLIINYEGLEIVRDDIEAAGYDLFIVDEATAYKNARSKRWKVLNSLIKPNTWLWMMTGTPAAQSPVDAFGLAKLVNPTTIPKYFSSFQDIVMTKVTQFKWVPKPDAAQTVHRVLQPAIRFSKEECLDLPEMTYVKRDVPLTPQQKKYYDELRKEQLFTADGEEVTAANAAIIMNKLLQISSGAVYSDNKESLAFDISKRYAVLKEVIDESSQKVLIFAPFKHVIRAIKDKLAKDKITAEIISGDVSANKRTDIFKRFQQDQNPRVLIIQPQAAAHGVTLTAANTVVWWGPTSSLEIYAQANARVHRTGQKHPSTVVQLQGSPAEKHIYSLLDNRINVHSEIVNLYKKLLD
jgi:SNF2 family DNA or RNA helicase